MPLKQIEGITRLLRRSSDGDQAAPDELVPLVYDELRRVAIGYLQHERGNGNITLQPTDLVYDVYLRIAGRQNVTWQSRSQFFSLAAAMMRNILVDYARQVKAAKQ